MRPPPRDHVLAVDLRNLTKRFGPVTAVNDLSLEIESGEIVAVLVADGTTSEIKNLASGRVVRATLPDADERTLRALGGVTNVECRGDTVLVQCADSDSVARYLLTHTAARDLEISSKNLEAAFVALTSDGAENGASR